MTWTYVCGIVICIIFSNIFSSAEMSYSSCNRMRLENARDGGSKRAGVAVKIVDHFDDSLSAILIGNNLANIANSALGSLLVLELCSGDDSYAWVSTLAITVLVIIFGETIPKIIAKGSANRLALTYAYFVRGLTIIFMPLIRLVVGLIKLLTLGLKGEQDDTDEEAAVEELSSIIETAEDEDVLDEDRSELVQAAIDFSDIMASEVMTARVDVVALDIDEDMSETLEIIENAPFSRIPVYEDSIDNVIGVLYLNHFLKALAGDEKPDIRSLLMPPCYIYKTMKLPAVLTELRKAKQHLAVVTDEYGGTLGILSMEDVLEQLVGEIWDDTDEIKEEILERSDGELELDATLTSRDTINAKIRVILDEATDPWGIKVNRVELKNIIPPREIQDAMEKQMKAERHRREAILTAEGEKASKILVAEGHKESQILDAEAQKQAAILRAEAVKEAKIREAEGEAEAILAVQRANAKAIELINQANPNQAVLTLKSLEAFAKAADGQATKIIIPSEIQGIAGLATSLKELVTDENKE